MLAFDCAKRLTFYSPGLLSCMLRAEKLLLSLSDIRILGVLGISVLDPADPPLNFLGLLLADLLSGELAIGGITNSATAPRLVLLVFIVFFRFINGLYCIDVLLSSLLSDFAMFIEGSFTVLEEGVLGLCLFLLFLAEFLGSSIAGRMVVVTDPSSRYCGNFR